MSETKLTGAACRWCGSDDDECLYTQCHDLPDGEEHAPCGAYFPSEDNVSDAGIGRAALTLAQVRIRELEGAVADEVDRLRPHYLSGTATDIARRQMLDHFAAKFPRALKEAQP